jgi:hypothetical protein
MSIRPLLIVDGANVVGSVPDGWWRDRAGAALRLREALAPVPTEGLPGLAGPVQVVLVVEGAARGLSSTEDIEVVSSVPPCSVRGRYGEASRSAAPIRSRTPA